jgi:hypothetical protein
MARILSCVTILLLLCGAAEPLADIVVNPVPEWYAAGGQSMPASRNFGDIIFYSSPDPSSLSEAERYLLFGAMSRDGRTTIRPQWEAIRTIATSFEAKHGTLPAAIDAEMINAAYSQPLDEAGLARFRNPITGDFPRLDAAEFSPGNLFIKRLTADEVAAVLGDPANLPPDAASGKAYYVRVYGEDDVLLSRIVIDADMSKFGPASLPPNPNRPDSLK